MDQKNTLICSECGLEKEDGCLCSFQYGNPMDEKEVEELFQKYFTSGEKAIEEGQYEGGKNFFLKALSLKPESQKATEFLKKTEEFLRQGHFDRLVKEGKELMGRGHWGGAKAKLETALIFKRESEVEALVEDLRKKVGEEQFRLFAEEGNRFWQAGAIKEAVECWDKALYLQEDGEIRKLYEEAQNKLVRVHIVLEEAQELADQGEWFKALKHLERGFEVYPEDHDLLVTAAFFASHRDEYRDLWNQGRRSELRCRFFKALIAYRTLLLYSPNDRKVKIRLWIIQFKFFFLILCLTLLVLWFIGKVF